MAEKGEAYTKLQCESCKSINYLTHKSKALGEKRLELRKFCKHCKKHTLHRETKK